MTAHATAPIHSFGARGVQHLLEGFRSLGIDGGALCRDAGLPPARLRDPSARVEARILLALFALAEARSGDPLIGLHVAEEVRFGGLAGYLVGSQNTIADALAMQERFQLLLLGAHAVALRPRPEGAFVQLDAGSPPSAVRHLAEYCVGSTCRMLRWLTPHGARPEAVHFQHAQRGDDAEYERFFGCAVRFDMTATGAILSHETLAEPVVSAHEELAATLEFAARAELGRPAIALRDAVVWALRASRLDRDSCRREAVARRLGVSERTLQRRLADEGTSFAAVLDAMRRETALALIADPAVSVAEIGGAVGYADQFAFNKAFRRWTGRSPSAYRRALLARA